MIPDTWGRYLWYSIHFIALDYSENPSNDDALKYKTFFENLGNVIPCYKCSVNYKKHLSELPIDAYLSSREDLFAWTVQLHNIVNKELGKPIFSIEEAKKKYTDPDFHENCFKIYISNKKYDISHVLLYMIGLVFILTIGGIVMSRKFKR